MSGQGDNETSEIGQTLAELIEDYNAAAKLHVPGGTNWTGGINRNVAAELVRMGWRRKSNPNRIRPGEAAMKSELKHKSKVSDDLRSRERKHQENALDDALKNTFPASDPVSAEQPTPPAVDRDRAKN